MDSCLKGLEEKLDCINNINSSEFDPRVLDPMFEFTASEIFEAMYEDELKHHPVAPLDHQDEV